MAERRYGDWFQTFTGRKFWPLDPVPDEIFIEDIAHALSLLCRFGGHCKEFYSVAQHSCLGVLLGRSYNLLKTKKEERDFLLHDGSEAYLVDLPRPIKRDGGQFGLLYQEYETNLDGKLALRFDLDFPMLPIIKSIDTRMLLTEKRDLLADPPGAWKASEADFPLFKEAIIPWSPSRSEETFLELFKELTA